MKQLIETRSNFHFLEHDITLDSLLLASMVSTPEPMIFSALGRQRSDNDQHLVRAKKATSGSYCDLAKLGQFKFADTAETTGSRIACIDSCPVLLSQGDYLGTVSLLSYRRSLHKRLLAI